MVAALPPSSVAGTMWGLRHGAVTRGRDPAIGVRFSAPRYPGGWLGVEIRSWMSGFLPRAPARRKLGARGPRRLLAHRRGDRSCHGARATTGAGGCGGRATAAPGAAGGAQLRRPRNCGGRGMPAAGKPGAVALRRPRGATRKARRHPARHPRGSWTLPRKRMVPVWRSLTVNAKGRSTSNGGGPADSSMTPPVTAAASVPSSSTRM